MRFGIMGTGGVGGYFGGLLARARVAGVLHRAGGAISRR